jgi:hypothetical protein
VRLFETWMFKRSVAKTTVTRSKLAQASYHLDNEDRGGIGMLLPSLVMLCHPVASEGLPLHERFDEPSRTGLTGKSYWNLEYDQCPDREIYSLKARESL